MNARQRARFATAQTQFPSHQFSGIFLAAFLAMILPSAEAIAQADTSKLNPAEKWVVEQVKAGKLADLSEKFPNKEGRKLGATFLEDLLTGSKPHRNGVRISGAIIDEAINFTNAEILFEVWLKKCEFSSNATFLRANFAGVVSFNESVFKRGAYFNYMKVGDTVSFDKAVFEGPADFAWGQIAGSFDADECSFRTSTW